MFFNRNLTVSTKVAVYKLAYGCESWIPYRRHIKALEAYHIRCLQSILDIPWWHRKTEICQNRIHQALYNNKDNFDGCVTSYVSVFHVVYSMANDQLSWPTKPALL